ncbi:hypothetical protein BI364_06995 [Acidihalobacter yilgarnensis]|uniref:Uncharacterized protein n=2 Tax=Acidihalobacter yilgarnensis TaxID=2819280 RepID=A0A1D8IMP1_9GAMM|nr:hypothetical protein BI364_06995 [Acidihalobacter yilgarnensis]
MSTRHTRHRSGFVGLLLLACLALAPMTAQASLFNTQTAAPTMQVIVPHYNCQVGSSLANTYAGNVFFGMQGFSQDMRAAGDAMAGHAIYYGNIMLRAFLIIALMWYGFGMLTDVGGAYLEPSSMIRTFITLGAVILIFRNYYPIAHALIHIFQEIGGGLVGVSNQGNYGDPSCVLFSTGDGLLHSMFIAPVTNVSLWHVVMDEGVSTLIEMWLYQVAIFLVAALMIVAGGFYFFWSIVSMFLLAIAIGLGPLVIPMLVFDWTQKLAFDSWLGFLWDALMYQIVGPAVLGVAGYVVSNAIAPIANTTPLFYYSQNHFHINWSPLFGMGLVALAVVWFSWKLPSLVRQLSAGAAHAGDFGAGKEMGGLKGMLKTK